MRAGRGRLLRRPLHRGNGAAGALGLPLEPQARRPHQRARIRRHEDRAHLVCRRQIRLPHAAHAVPDVLAVPVDQTLRRALLRRPAGRGRSRAGYRGDQRRFRRVRDDRGEVGGDRHWRRRPRVPREHQRRHRHRRRHGAGLSSRRAAARHGIRAIPPDLHAGHRPAVHRGLSRRRRLPGQQGRLSLPAGLWPRAGRADAAQQGDGTGSARSIEPGLLVRATEGPHHRGYPRFDRASRFASSRS